MRVFNRFLLIVATVVVVPLVVFAQEEEIRTVEAKDSIVVEADRFVMIPTTGTIATKLPVSLHSTPASIGVVTSALFENQDGVILGDALRNVSGVNVQTGFGIHDFFIVRGFESLSNGLVLTDGTSEPEVTFYNLYNIEQIEVLKGPGAFLYGGNPLSGTVNLVQKQPIFKNFSRAIVSTGHFQSHRGTLDLGVANPDAGLALRLNTLWRASDNYRDDKDNQTYAFNPALTWRINNRSTFNVNLEYVNSEYSPDSGLPLLFSEKTSLPDVSRTASYQSADDVSDQKIFRLKIDYNIKLSDALTFRNKFYYTDLDWTSNSTLLNGAYPIPFIGELVNRSSSTLSDRQKMVGNQLELQYKFGTGSVKHNLLTGFEFSRLSDDFEIKFVGASPVLLSDPGTAIADPFGLEGIPQYFTSGDGRSLIYAPYFIDQLSFSEQFQIFLGGRFDAINYSDDRSDLLGSLGIVPSQTERDYNKFSPMIGFVFSPRSQFSLYANAGRAFAPPSSQVPGDPKAEESTQYELGTKNKLFKDKVNLTFALFQLEKENITIPTSDGQSKAIGSQKSTGIELEINAQFSKNWISLFSYAFLNSELTDFSEFELSDQQDPYRNRSGNTPAFAPKHILDFWTTKEFNNGVGVGGGGRYVSSQFIAPDNQFEIDGVLTFDASFHYKIKNWRWSLNLKNLTDAEYETRGFNKFSVIPANPFAVYSAVEFMY